MTSDHLPDIAILVTDMGHIVVNPWLCANPNLPHDLVDTHMAGMTQGNDHSRLPIVEVMVVRGTDCLALFASQWTLDTCSSVLSM